MTKKPFFIGSLIIFLVALVSGCGAEREEAFGASRAVKANSAVLADTAMPAAGEPARMMTESAAPVPGEPAPESAARKMITRGSMNIEVEDLDAAEKELRGAVEAAGGYVQSSNRRTESFSMTLKIPAEGFEAFLDSASAAGRVESRSVNVEDVTGRYYDLEHRIKNKEILVERYQEYLKRAQDVEELLTVERALNETVMELERLQGSFKDLSRLIEFSTLHLTVVLPSWDVEEKPLPSLREGLKRFGRAALQGLYSLFFILLGIVVFGLPGALLLGLLYWLAFGRVGILRRFFRRLRPRRREAAGMADSGTAPREGGE